MSLEIEVRVFAIKHKPTGTWMPSRMGRSGRGWSYWNPGYVHPEYGVDKPYDANPRLFFTEQSARNALTMWLQGQWREHHTQGNYFEPPEPDGIAPDKPPVERRREDVEIVPLKLTGPGL